MYATALVTVSALAVLVMADVELIVDKDNSAPFFIGSEKLATISTTLATAARDNAAISSLLDAALSQKYENATIRAWRRLVSGNATLVASAGPALSGNIKCFVGDNGEVVGLQYGSAVVCQKTSRIVHVKIGTNYISNIKVGGFFFYDSSTSAFFFLITQHVQQNASLVITFLIAFTLVFYNQPIL